MTRLACIQELRDCPAMDAVADAIEVIRTVVDRWGDHMRRSEPEEYAKTERILGALIELQVVETGKCVREGETMNIRRAAEALAEAQTIGEAA